MKQEPNPDAAERQRCEFWAMGWQHVAMGPTAAILNKHKRRRVWIGGTGKGHKAWSRMFRARERDDAALFPTAT